MGVGNRECRDDRCGDDRGCSGSIKGEWSCRGGKVYEDVGKVCEDAGKVCAGVGKVCAE